MASTTSTSALSRARSLRKPSSRPETTSSSGELRNVSPSRLPIKGQPSGAAPSIVWRICSYRFDILAAAREDQQPCPRSITPGPSYPYGFHSPGVHFEQSIYAGVANNKAYHLFRGTHCSPGCFGCQHRPGAGHRARIPACPRQVLRDDPVQQNNPPAAVTDVHYKLIHHRARPRPPALVRPHPTVAGVSRSTLANHRHRSPATTLTSNRTPQTQLLPLTTTPSTPSTPAPAPKPAFNTHQQQYTPLKPPAPKPLTSTILAPPSPSKLPANIALSAETARLQAELLQLHLLHRDATATRAEWERSAWEVLRVRFEEVREGGEGLVEVEGEVAEGRVAEVLRGWGGLGGGGSGGGGGGMGLEEKVVVLDGVVTGLWGMGEPAGRYERVVRGFEAWVGGVERVLEGRRRGRGGEGVNGESESKGGEEGEGIDIFIPTPSAAWRAEHAALVRRLDEWRRSLLELGDAPPPPPRPAGEEGGEGEEEPSSLSRMLAGCRALVTGMLAELEVMEQMEREAVADEMAWVREMNRGSGGVEEGAPRAGAMWRVL
ncbi:hypothetical protein F5144DRAFT_631109 [Chaetomium tenue]|uniref:Uncharacterized protein n=1 Tax=Chaetomium tenue TaxID=1854479 RepID=A0ACB7P3Q1_9PEZI|nr:hypothetical protein F5144DRAFT_631109 [Chaetomium globosum]